MLTIIKIPSAILREISKPVETFDPRVKALTDIMKTLCTESLGIGLSAIQLGIPSQIMIISEDGKDFKVICNPKILKEYGSCIMQEGCLSMPGVFINKKRAKSVIVCYKDMDGRDREELLDGKLARCFQHEFGHFQGLLMDD